MDVLKLGWVVIVMALLSGCSNVRAARLLLPEQFGLSRIDDGLYVETGADDETRTKLITAVTRAENAIRTAYGGVESRPVVNACITDACYASFGGMGSRAKIYGNYILLSPQGLDWHFLAHEWSHDEIRSRLTTMAWWRRLPQWFDEGVAVTISRDPKYSEEHWRYLISANVPRPSRQELLACRSLTAWLDTVRRFGATQNRERREKGEPEVRPVYTAAGHEVRPWLDTVGTKGLWALIDGLNRGEPFEHIYTHMESPAGLPIH